MQICKHARKPRIHFPGALYHVIARGNRGQKIFRSDSDYELYLQFLEEYKERYHFELSAYALLPNHLHPLIEVLKIPTEFINSADRNRLGALGRGVVGHIGRKLGGHTIKEVAEHFNRDPVAITQGVKKVEAKLKEESDFKEAIEKIEKRLTKKRQKKYLITYA